MIVVRRVGAAAVVAGLVLLAGPAWAQEQDPCAPGPDGSVPQMCQGGAAPEPEPEPAPPAPEPDLTDPCPMQPVEPGDGVVTDEGDQGVAAGEPDPGTPVEEGEVKPEPAPDEPTMEAPVSDEPTSDDEPVMCAFRAPVSAPVDSGAPQAAAGGGAAAPEAAAPDAAANGAVAAGQLPRTGPKERLAALAALGLALLLVGAGTTAAGRRRLIEAPCW